MEMDCIKTRNSLNHSANTYLHNLPLYCYKSHICGAHFKVDQRSQGMQKLFCFGKKLLCHRKGRRLEELCRSTNMNSIRAVPLSSCPFIMYENPCCTFDTNASYKVTLTTVSPSEMAATLLHFLVTGFATPSFTSQLITLGCSQIFNTQTCKGGGRKYGVSGRLLISCIHAILKERKQHYIN